MSEERSSWTKFKLSDWAILVSLGISFIGLFIAIQSYSVAVLQLEQATKDSEEQRQSLNASRARLQTTVDAATKQQELLSKNLEISIAQQELLTKNLETSKAQLGILEEQWKREQERQARKPKIEITLKGFSQDLRSKSPLPLNLKINRTAILAFIVTNSGNSPVLNPLVSVAVDPQTVKVDRPNSLFPLDRQNPYRYQTKALDIHPVGISRGGYDFHIEVLVPPDVEKFRLSFQVFGENLPAQQLELVFLAIPPKT
jgi:hypothetical protein